MKDNISPEEKLLKLIKAEKKSTPPYLPPHNMPIDRKITSSISSAKLGGKDSIHSYADTYLTPLYLQGLMTILIVMSFIYLIVSFIYPWVSLEEIRLPEVPSEKVKTEEPKLELREEPKPYEFYLQAISKRQIFSSPSIQEGTGAASPAVKPVAGADLIKDINLVGIISGENSQAVIEDKKTSKTYYLTKGQFIGEFQVEDIQEGKIILNYKGQRFELYL